jgi:hypothetical protein
VYTYTPRGKYTISSTVTLHILKSDITTANPIMAQSPLPFEIWHDILQDLDRSRRWGPSYVAYAQKKITIKDMGNIGLSCRFLADATRPFVFQTVKIYSQARCDGLLELLAKNRDLATYICHVYLVGAPNMPRHWDPNSLWMLSGSGRSLLPFFKSIPILTLEGLDLTRDDVHELVYQNIAPPLHSCVRLEIGDSCVATAWEVSKLLTNAPRLEHLEMSRSTLQEYEGDVIPFVRQGLSAPLNLCVSRLFFEPYHANGAGTKILNQLGDCLRSSGRFRASRNISLRIGQPTTAPSLWLLLRDAALTLEHVELEVNTWDHIAIALLDSTLEMPQLTSLVLHVSHPKLNECAIESCVELISILRPSLPLSLTFHISIHRRSAEDFAEIKRALGGLDACLATPALTMLCSVQLVFRGELRPFQRPESTRKEIVHVMSRTEQRGILECSVIDR